MIHVDHSVHLFMMSPLRAFCELCGEKLTSILGLIGEFHHEVRKEREESWQSRPQALEELLSAGRRLRRGIALISHAQLGAGQLSSLTRISAMHVGSAVLEN